MKKPVPYYTYQQKSERMQEKFYESLRDQIRWSNYMKTKHELKHAGPNSLKSKISRGTLARSKKIPVTLSKMSWDK
jgi:hypothetical protein